MKRTRPAGADSPSVSAVPSEEHAALALREAAALLAPVVRWLLRNGVSYNALANQLKPVFVDAARAELERGGVQPTGSALSVLSGVHRKDVRTITEAPRGAAPVAHRGVPLASQVFTRWMTARRYRTRDGAPRALPRSGAGITFESLSRELSLDVHPRTVMDELLRLGLVTLEDDLLVPASTTFVPSRRLDELTALFSANAGDHIAAAVHNLTLDAPRYLEQSVFADGLGADSVATLHEHARAAWSDAFAMMVKQARKHVAADADVPDAERQRMRFGVYFYSEPTAPTPRPGKPAGTPAPRVPRPRGRRTP
ncbi:hypothetical protein HZ992_25025 [Rhizobacter sp. AJA081-3]|jgi:hypothetical protein|uniref:DUF6502 family protein n=1 Tax=Rhizobacter sp. AJA081-3 TaxID=2753607 RepID=UPI001ADF1F6B|nr:DUF6502 family protein [Rhizobacter sp. AJA081-3]QTN23328.1 hypothetical protein HZ992_25025 [Rhizobacter sp. AJA081-3]